MNSGTVTSESVSQWEPSLLLSQSYVVDSLSPHALALQVFLREKLLTSTLTAYLTLYTTLVHQGKGTEYRVLRVASRVDEAEELWCCVVFRPNHTWRFTLVARENYAAIHSENQTRLNFMNGSPVCLATGVKCYV